LDRGVQNILVDMDRGSKSTGVQINWDTGMIKSANQNTNIEKGAVVILLICTYVIKNSLKNIAYKYPPIYLLFSILNLLLGKSKVR
jgi:hypothetical protein